MSVGTVTRYGKEATTATYSGSTSNNECANAGVVMLPGMKDLVFARGVVIWTMSEHFTFALGRLR